MKIAVIGGGVMGLACAWRLARAGTHVNLFDAAILGAATLASLGALWPASPLSLGPTQTFHHDSLWAFEPFLNQLTAASGIPIAFRRLGRIEMLNSPKAVARAKQEAAHANTYWPSFGAEPTMQVLTPSQVEAFAPGVTPSPHGALLCRATAQVKVAELISALREAASRAGVTFHSAKVTTIQQQNNHLTAITAANTSYPTDAALIAAGAWSTPFLHDPATVVRPVKGQGISLRLSPGIKIPLILKSGPIYLVPWDDVLLVGSTTEPEAGFNPDPTPEARDQLFQAACEIIPDLRTAQILRHWAGLRPQNSLKPHHPLMRCSTLPNLFLCTAHYKIGIAMAPLASEKMTEMILLSG